MKQKISSSSSINASISFNKSNPYIDETEDLSYPYDLCTDTWEYQIASIINHMRNQYKCVECQNIVSSIKDHLDVSHADLLCEFCSNLLFDYEEPFVENHSPRKRIFIRFSCPQVKNIDEKTDILKNKIETTNINIQNLQDQFRKIENLLQRCCEQFSLLKTIDQQQNIGINQLKSNQNAFNEKYKEIQQKMEDYHYATYNGEFIWKIDNWQNKYNESRSGQQTSCFSPIFYSSPSGYKMRAQLYPYGDDNATGEHMSIHLAILKGDYDKTVAWPFNYSVIFCLFDQTGQNHHITDITPATSEKPSSAMNIVGGISKFCPLALIERQENHYVQDNTLFIKIMVDFLGIPRELVPYTMSLNPGLPTHLVEAQRQIEMEKYKQLREQFVATMNQEAQNQAQRAQIPMYPLAVINLQPSSALANSESVPCEESIK